MLLLTACQMLQAKDISPRDSGNDEPQVNGTTGTPLGGFGCGGVKFNANNGTFAVMPSPPADAYDFTLMEGARLTMTIQSGGKTEVVERMKASLGTDNRPADDAIWPLHRVDFGTVGGIHVTMTGYSPLDNVDYDNMHLPYALYEVTLENKGKQTATADFSFVWPGKEDEWYVASDKPQKPVALSPGKIRKLHFVLAWYCRTDPELGYYMNLYRQPKDIACHGLKVFDTLKANAERLVNGMRGSSLPRWMVNQTLNTLSAIVIGGMYKRDGRTAFAEGQWTCFGTMDQMWHARQIICQLMPRYAWQELDYWARTQMRNGQIHHDCNYENRAKDKARRSRLVAWDDTEHEDYRDIQRWVDLNAAFIISVFEIYRATADHERLMRLWPNMKRAAQRIIDQVAEYGSKEYPYTFCGTQNSYDHGGNPDPYNAQISAVAYRIMSILAKEENEPQQADVYERAFSQAVSSFHDRYVRDREPLTGMHCESVYAGQWLALHLGLGELWGKDDTDFVLQQLDNYYRPTERGLGFTQGTYDEWTPYILTHYAGLLLNTGRYDTWEKLQHDAWQRQYNDRNKVFDHRLNILAMPAQPVWTATNIKSKGQYISMPAIWRNYYDLIGIKRDAHTKELWLTPLRPVEKAFFITPEGNGTISCEETAVRRKITVSMDRGVAVSTLYLRDDITGDVAITIDGKRYPYRRTGSGHARMIAVKWNVPFMKTSHIVVEQLPYAHKTDKRNSFYSERPAQRWEESLVTGNGVMGAMIDGSPYDEKIVVNHAGLFLPLNPIMLPPSQEKHIGRIRQMMIRGEYHEASQLVVDLANNEGYRVKHASDAFVPAFQIRLQSDNAGYKEYRRGVDFETGEATVSFTDGKGYFERRVFASRADSVVVVRLKAGKGTIDTHLSIERVTTADSIRRRKFRLDERDGLRTEQSGREGSALYYRAQFQIPEKGCGHRGYDGYEGVLDIVSCDGSVTYDGRGLRISGATDVLLLCKVSMTRDFSHTDITNMKRQMETLPADYNALLHPHVAIHKPLYNSVSFSLGASDEERGLPSEKLLARGGRNPALIERLFNAARYNVISATGLHAPNLQGIWGATMTPNWSGDFTTNGNLPVAVSHYLQSGTPELMLPLFNQMETMMDDFRTNAKMLYGCRGIHVPSHFTWHGYDNQFDATWPMTFWHTGAPWYGLFYWDYYLYTQDRGFLHDRALPFMEEAALFLEDFLQEDSTGTYFFNPSYSPENRPKNYRDQACINATMDVASSTMLLRALIAASEELGVNMDKTQKWRLMLKKMPAYQTNHDGELREWLWRDMEDNHEHRHASHLFGLYDLHDHALTDNPVLRDACLKTIDRRMEFRRKENTGVMAFGICQLAFSAAALGEASRSEEMLGWLGDNYFMSNMFSTHDPHKIFNCDISGGYPSLVMKMLCYSEPGVIQLLPAKPASWTHGRIEGMALRGGITMRSLSWEGKSVCVTLCSKNDQTVTLKLRDNIVKRLRLKAGREVTIKI